MNTTKCDVLIIGCGISGSVAALYLSKKGFDIIVIEKEPVVGGMGGERIDITESRGLKHIVDELKLPVKDVTNKTKWFSPNYSFDLESRIDDLYIKRGNCLDSFEVNVIKSALDNSAKLILDTSVVEFNYKNNLVESVIIKRRGENELIKPKIVIGADGPNSQVLRLLGQRMMEEKITSISGYGVFGKDFNLPSCSTHIFFDKENAPGGYFYIAKSHDNNCVATAVVDTSQAGKNLETYYNSFLKNNTHVKQILDGATITSTLKGMYGQVGHLKNRVSGNVILVGEAARTLDPFFGYGIRNSLISSYVASDIVSSSLSSGDIRTLETFDSLLQPHISDINNGLRMRKIFKKLNNKDVDFIVKGLSELQNEGMNLDDISRQKSKLLFYCLRNMAKSAPLGFKIFSSFFSR